jgi:hypothetical protein
MKPTTHRLMIAGIAVISLATIALVPKPDKRAKAITERIFKRTTAGSILEGSQDSRSRGSGEVVAPGAI